MSRKRKQPETSQSAHDQKTDDSKNRDWERILSALRNIGSGTYEEIANYMQEKDLNVVSRRMKEMRDMNLIRRIPEKDSFVKRKTSRGRESFVHTICGENEPKTNKEVAYKKNEKTAAEFASDIINSTSKTKSTYIQTELL